MNVYSFIYNIYTVCPACRDYISESNYVDILDNEGNTIKRLTDCDTLVNDYLYLCKKEYGQEGGHCCESCSDQGKPVMALVLIN